MICSIPQCERDRYARSWCSLHYSRWYDHGDPLWTPRERVERHLPIAHHENAIGAIVLHQSDDAICPACGSDNHWLSFQPGNPICISREHPPRPYRQAIAKRESA